MPDVTGRLAAAAWHAAAVLASLPLRLMLRRRVATGKEIATRLPERRGIDSTPRPAGPLLWMHAASVGETISVLPVLQALTQRAPGLGLLLTTGTVTSAGVAAARLPPSVQHRFMPLDVPAWVARFVDHWRPDAACFVESEIWPNTLAVLAQRRVPVALLNGRISTGSLANWRRMAGLARRLFGGFALIWARSGADAARLQLLSGRAVASPGDLKFAADPLPVDEAALASLRHQLHERPIWVAASLHPGEDAVVAEAHALLAPLHPGLVTVLVPRHPGRAAAMAKALPMPRRSLGQPLPHGGLYLADTLGELGLFYRLASCAFVGGSLVPHGGQNPLEPARLGRPVAMGPHGENFADARAVLQDAGALSEVADAAALAGWVASMLDDPAACAAAGVRGAAAATRWQDLPARAAQALLELMV